MTTNYRSKNKISSLPQTAAASSRRLLALAITLFAPLVCATIPDVIVTVDRIEGQETGNDGSSPLYNIDPLYVKRAAFGSTDDVKGELVLAPSDDPYLCEMYNTTRNETSQKFPKPTHDTVILAARGHCTFERKAHAAKHMYGAKAILIYDELSARYNFEGNDTSGKVLYPIPKWDYDCLQGSNTINESIPLDPPAYNGSVLDPLMDMTKADTSICTLQEGRQTCESQLCLAISRIPNSTLYRVCCAWDVPLTMPKANDTKELDTDDIVALFLTIRQGQEITNNDLLGRQVLIKSRGQVFNITYLFMWGLGTVVVAGASWYAASDYRSFGIKLAAYKERINRNAVRNTQEQNRPHQVIVSDDRVDVTSNETGSTVAKVKNHKRSSNDLAHDIERDDSHFCYESNDSSQKKQSRTKQKKTPDQHNTSHKRKGGTKDQEVISLHSIPPSRTQNQTDNSSAESRPVFVLNFRRDTGDYSGEDRNTRRSHQLAANNQPLDNADEAELPELPVRESGRMKAFEMNQWHVLIFIVTASLLLILLFFFQFYTVIFVIYGIGCAGAISYLVFNPFVTWFFPKFGDEVVEEMNKKVICGLNGFDVTSQLAAYVWAAIWIWFGITKYRPETNPFFWLSMDLFGICFCFVTMSILKLNSIKIATLLMVAIFLYDIFFVFITPFLTGGDSIMLTVAGGGGASGWEDYCYRYPDDRECRGITFLPMLLLLPKVNDFADRSVILGLGDIILPGFLMGFCARHDEACRLVDAHLPNSGVDGPRTWYQGFFFPMVIAYSIGLLIAFLAVLGMEQGQPALLYIVPTCLGTMFFIGRKDLNNLWSGAKAITVAERFIERTERSWGKARMKRFVERRRRENAAAAAPSTSQEPIEEHCDGDDLSVDLVSNSVERKEIDARYLRENPVTSENEYRTDSGPHHRIRRHSKDRVVPQYQQEHATTDHKENNHDNSNTDELNDQPTFQDVCFGARHHPGTIALQKAVKSAYDMNNGAEFNPQIFKSIRKVTTGIEFYCTSKEETETIRWIKASKKEIRDEMWKMYEDYRCFLAHQNK